MGERNVSRVVGRCEASSTQPITRLMVGEGSSETVTTGGHRRARVRVWPPHSPERVVGWCRSRWRRSAGTRWRRRRAGGRIAVVPRSGSAARTVTAVVRRRTSFPQPRPRDVPLPSSPRPGSRRRSSRVRWRRVLRQSAGRGVPSSPSSRRSLEVGASTRPVTVGRERIRRAPRKSMRTPCEVRPESGGSACVDRRRRSPPVVARVIPRPPSGLTRRAPTVTRMETGGSTCQETKS